VLSGLRGTRPKVFLFGSQARKEARASSDIDVAVLAETPVPPAVLARIRQVLEESAIPYEVDLVDLSRAEPLIVVAVLSEAIPWTD
jgi:hypothetical protein